MKVRINAGLLMAFAGVLVIAGVTARFAGRTTGLIVLTLLVGGFWMRALLVWRAYRQLQGRGAEAGAALEAGQALEAVRICDEAIQVVRKKKLSPDAVLAGLFVTRSEAARKLERKEEALGFAAQAFACMCGVKTSGAQLAILDQLGLTLLENSHERRAIPILEAAIVLGHQIDAEPLNAAARMDRCGLAYSRVGMHDKAASSFGRVVDILTRQKGSDALELSNPYTNLGNAYKRLEKMQDAERCQREALRLLRVNGVRDPEKISLVLLNLGVACAESGRNQEAEAYYHEVLELRSAALGRNHPGVGRTYNNLANCRRRMGDLETAEDYAMRAIEILQRQQDSLSNALDTLSRIREDQGRTEEALAEAVRAREIQQNRPTPNLSELAAMWEREGLLASRTGDEARAEECRVRAGQIRSALSAAPPEPRQHSSVKEALQNLEQHFRASLEHVKLLHHAV